MEPTMGRIVLYTPPDPNDVSAVEAPSIVTRVNKGDAETPATVDLTVFPPGAAPYPVANAPLSSSGRSESGCWCWPPAAPGSSAPEPTEPEPEAETPSDPDPAPPAEEPTSTGDGSGEQGNDEPAKTSASSEKPLYLISGDVVPDGFATSGLETPDGKWLWHFAGDTGGEQHTFDLASDSCVELYAEADDNEQPVQPATPVESA